MVSPGSLSTAKDTSSGQAPTASTPNTASVTENAQAANRVGNAVGYSTAQPPESQLTAPTANMGPSGVPAADAPPGRTMRPRKPPPPVAPKGVRKAPRPRPRAPPPPPVAQPAMIRNTITGGWMINPRHRDSVVNFHRRNPQMAKPWNDLANEVKQQDEGVFKGEEYDDEETEDDENGKEGEQVRVEGTEDENAADEVAQTEGEVDAGEVSDTRKNGEELTDSPAPKKYPNVFESDESDAPETPTQVPQDRKAWLWEQQDNWNNER